MKTKRGQDVSALNQIRRFVFINILVLKFNDIIDRFFQNRSKQLAPPWSKASDSGLGFPKYYVFNKKSII